MPSTADRKSGSRTSVVTRAGGRLTRASLTRALTLLATVGLVASAQGQAPGRTRAPLTDLDPAPYQPPPSTTAAPSGVGSLSASSHVDTAIHTALEFVAAVRDGDAARIRALLADDLYQLGERDLYRPTTAPIALRSLVRTTSSGAPRTAPSPLARLVQVQAAEVGPPQPSSIEGRRFLPSDTVVSFPVTPEGRAELARSYPAWRSRVRVLVRTAGPPRVIGF